MIEGLPSGPCSLLTTRPSIRPCDPCPAQAGTVIFRFVDLTHPDAKLKIEEGLLKPEAEAG